MKRLRHNYIVFDDTFLNVVRSQLELAISTFLPSETTEIFLSINYAKLIGNRKEIQSEVFLDELNQFTSDQSAASIKENLIKAVAPESRSEFKLYGLNDFELIHVNIFLDMEGRNFFFSDQSGSKLSFFSINLISRGGNTENLRMFKHFLETELRNDYQNHIFQALILANEQVDNSIEFSDPSDLFVLYIEKIKFTVPDIDIVHWRLASDDVFLQCDACSDPSFDCDILEPNHNLLIATKNHENLEFPSISKYKTIEQKSPGVFCACFDRGWRSASFYPIKIGRLSVGLIGIFVRYPGIVPKIYDQFIDFLLQQTARFIVEKRRISELMLLKAELKKLVPLLAVGNEVLQRNHDIRDQISIVRSNLILIRDADLEVPHSQLKRNASSALDAIQRMTDVLSKQLQGFRSAKEARRSLRVSILINEINERMQVIAGIENVSLTINILNDPFVRVQKFYIERVIENIISNAIYFSKQTHDDNNIVMVEVGVSDSCVYIEVRDNGSGISQEPILKIFEIGETTKPDGYGIGLSVSKEIVESHGGVIKAKNNFDHGATFTIILPEFKN